MSTVLIYTCPVCLNQTIEVKDARSYFSVKKNNPSTTPHYTHKTVSCNTCLFKKRTIEDKESLEDLVQETMLDE